MANGRLSGTISISVYTLLPVSDLFHSSKTMFSCFQSWGGSSLLHGCWLLLISRTSLWCSLGLASLIAIAAGPRKRCRFGPVHLFPLPLLFWPVQHKNNQAAFIHDVAGKARLYNVWELFGWALDEGVVLWLRAMVSTNRYHQTLELHAFSMARCLHCEKHGDLRRSEVMVLKVWSLHQQHQHHLGLC